MENVQINRTSSDCGWVSLKNFQARDESVSVAKIAALDVSNKRKTKIKEIRRIFVLIQYLVLSKGFREILEYKVWNAYA